MEQIKNLAVAIYQRLCDGQTLFIFGNGGSAADANHFVGELIKSFEIKTKLKNADLTFGGHLEPGFRALSLNNNEVVISAIANDIGYDYIYAQQLVALARPNDIAIGLSTSGNTKNVINGLITAKELGLLTVMLTGIHQPPIAVDYHIEIKKPTTALIQEDTIKLLHQLARLLEQFAKKH